jgi:hypothetical protein
MTDFSYTTASDKKQEGMATVFNGGHTASHGYQFDWLSTPGQCGTSATELNDPKYSTPRPCKHGSKCYWKGHTRRGESSVADEETGRGCGFVHPGEEGIARRLFPGRTTVSEDRKQTWEPPVVRLVGGATYYERRRLGLSWPEWLEHVKEKKQSVSKNVLSAEAAPWTPPLPPMPYSAPQAPMLSAWFPPLPSYPPPGWELAYAQALLTSNPALRAVGSACARDSIADAIHSHHNPSYMPPPSITSYSWNPITQQVVKNTSTYTAEVE